MTSIKPQGIRFVRIPNPLIYLVSYYLAYSWFSTFFLDFIYLFIYFEFYFFGIGLDFPSEFDFGPKSKQLVLITNVLKTEIKKGGE